MEERPSRKLVVNHLSTRVNELLNKQIEAVRNGNLFTPDDKSLPSGNKYDDKDGNMTQGYMSFMDANPDLKSANPNYDPAHDGDFISGHNQRKAQLRSRGGSLTLALGEAPVINPPWQFGELDDVRSLQDYPFIGRVYYNEILCNYPILLIRPGRERYNKNPFSFFGIGGGGEASQLNDYIRNAGQWSPGMVIKEFLIGVKNIVLLPFTIIKGATKFFFGGDTMNKFIKFVPAIKLYARFFGDVAREVAGNLRLLNSDPTKPVTQELKDLGAKGIAGFESIMAGLFGKEDGEEVKQEPDIMESDNPADFLDFNTESWNDDAYKGSIKHLNLANILPNNTYGSADDPFAAIGSTAAMEYIPVMVQKSASVTETFGNSAEEHPLSQQMNQMAADKQNERTFGAASAVMDAMGQGGGIADKAQGLLNQFVFSMAGEVSKNVADMGILLNGAGRALFPHVWSNSNYSRSLSCDIKLIVPTGDPVSVFENIYIPFIMFFILATPIQTGKNLYMSPFIEQFYSRGIFSCEFGMVESLGVTRGTEKNDRTQIGLPRSMSLNVSIKDLAPVMMISLGGGLLWSFRSANSSLTDYLSTITGLTLADRVSLTRKIKNVWNKAVSIIQDDIFNLQNLSFNVMQSGIMRPVRFFFRNDKINSDVPGAQMKPY
jgi:hypothetical protein